MYDALILAGGAKKAKLLGPYEYEALVEIQGKPMVSFVAKALADSGAVKRIFVIGPQKELAECEFPPMTTLVAGGATLMDTIAIGMDALGHKDQTLVATADIPLLSAEAINDFLVKCAKVEADFYYPIVSKVINEQAFPATRRTYIRLQEGTFTGGNLFLVNPDVASRSLAVANRIIANRKNPLRLCSMLGWGFVVQFFCGTLRLAEVEQRVSELLKLRGVAIESQFAEIGVDVDKPSDLQLIRNALAADAERPRGN